MTAALPVFVMLALTLMSRNALKISEPPEFQEMGALTLTSRSALRISESPELQDMGALTLMSRSALTVSELLELQLIGALTKISPFCPRGLVVLSVEITTLLLASCV